MKYKLKALKSDHYRFGKKISEKELILDPDELFKMFSGCGRSADALYTELKNDKFVFIEKCFSESEKAKPEIKQEIKQAIIEEKKEEETKPEYKKRGRK